MSHWVLTTQVNDYNQHGDYYVHSWDNKPSHQELKLYTEGLKDEDILVLLNDGVASEEPYTGPWNCYELMEVK